MHELLNGTQNGRLNRTFFIRYLTQVTGSHPAHLQIWHCQWAGLHFRLSDLYQHRAYEGILT